VAKDAAGNVAANSPIVVQATTTNVSVPLGIQTIDFETVGKDWIWTIYENGDNTASNFTFVDNPATSGINSSATCAKFIVNANAATWAQVQTTGFSPITFTADNNKVKVMVYKSVISTIAITLQNADASVKLQKFAPNTKINEWEEMTFDFSGLVGKTVTKMIIFPDYPTTRTAGSVNYIDNIFYNSMTSETGRVVNETIKFYPNPVNDILHLELSGENNRIVLHDMLGKKVFDLQSTQSNDDIDLRTLGTGIYFLNVQNNNGGESRAVIIKK
jgi:hypothetical protein